MDPESWFTSETVSFLDNCRINRNVERIDRCTHDHNDGTSCTSEKWRFAWILFLDHKKVLRYAGKVRVGGTSDRKAIGDQLGFTDWDPPVLCRRGYKDGVTLTNIYPTEVRVVSAEADDGSSVSFRVTSRIYRELKKDISRTRVRAARHKCGKCPSMED